LRCRGLARSEPRRGFRRPLSSGVTMCGFVVHMEEVGVAEATVWSTDSGGLGKLVGCADPVALHYFLEQTHALRLARPSPTTLPRQPPIPRPLPADRIFKGDIIICIRDEFKPPVENLIRAYAINAELLRNTMEYFRTALLNTTEEQEAHGIQISLYVPKDLWEWLLHLAKIQYRQTRERLPVIKKSLALPLFSTAVLLGIKEARDICLRYLKQTWPSAILERDRS
ncbi:hypothetical protein BV898_19979, partial [Hypsibius exemplaris]